MKAIRPDFLALYQAHETEFLAHLKTVLKIPSVNGHKTFQAPFGIGPKRALETVLNIAKQWGFETFQVADCVGWVEYGPKTPDYFAILGHLDVVDVTDDWQYPPFDLTSVSGYLYGRGVLDNKGPLLSTLFALYLIKTQQIPLKQRLRIIFGTDEESGSRDIPHYLTKQPAPIAGFTPDCKFPAVYGERGLVDLTINYPITDTSIQAITAIDGPFDRSYIPDQASITINQETCKFTGEKAPSNAPDLADNALVKLVASQASLHGQSGLFFNWINQKIGDTIDGRYLGIDYQDKESGKLQLAFYQLSKTQEGLSINLTLRYPVTITEAQILTQLESQLLPEMTIQINRRYPSKLSDPDQPFIQKLSTVYQNATGLDGTPVTTTGITYARAMPNIIAFGPSFPGQKGIAHKGDEWLKLSDWQMMMQIYYDAILEICG